MYMDTQTIKSLYLKGVSAAKIGRRIGKDPHAVRRTLVGMGVILRSRVEARRLWGKVIPISSATLNDLYCNQKMSMYDIAERYGCSYNAIQQKMIKYKITRRSMVDAHALVPPKYPRQSCPNDPILKAYILGFRLGDLHVKRATPTSHTIVIQTNSTKEDQIDLFKRLFSPFGHVQVSPPDKRNARNMRCCLDWSFSFLLPKEDIIPKWVQQTKNRFASFLAGYVDAEGSFSVIRRHRVFQMKSYDKNILRQSAQLLKRYHIAEVNPYIVRKAGTRDGNGVIAHQDVWLFILYHRDILRKFIHFVLPHLGHANRIKQVNIVLKSLDSLSRI